MRLLATLVIVMLTQSCIVIESPIEIEITPEPVPAQLEGARWQDLPVHYCVSALNAGFVPPERLVVSVEAAFQSWGVATVNDGPCGSDPSSGNRRSEIGWGLPSDTGDGIHAAGYTQMLYQGCLGGCADGSESHLVEADIFLHPDPPRPFRNDDCLFTTLLHETGHFLGLHHLDSPAVMAPVSRDCPQELTPADRAALDALYP